MDDPVDLALVALPRVAVVAVKTGVDYKRPVLGQLAGQLFLVAKYLDDTAGSQKGKRVLKLLENLETICSWQAKSQREEHYLVEAIARGVPGSTAVGNVESQIRRGLLNFSAGNGRHIQDAIDHLGRFVPKNERCKKAEFNSTLPGRLLPPDYPSEVHTAVYDTLRKHLLCTCGKGISGGKHMAQLLLCLPSQHMNGIAQPEFDMLFSSTPSYNGSFGGRWQDLNVLVIGTQTKKKKSVGFADGTRDERQEPRSYAVQAPPGSAEVDEFCKFIRNVSETNSRVRLAIKGGILHKSGFEAIKQRVAHVPAISLAEILSTYSLSSRMKVALAYILAYSVWLYYDSQWVSACWTRETVWFMKENRTLDNGEEREDLFVWKPYISVSSHDANNPTPTEICEEMSEQDGEIHPYSKLRALGVMLAEIGKGSPLLAEKSRPTFLVERHNSDVLQAVACAEKGSSGQGHCEFDAYWDATRRCLDRKSFPSSDEGAEKVRQRRRNALYELVVVPLEELLKGTGWLHKVSSIAALEISRNAPANAPVRNTKLQEVSTRSMNLENREPKLSRSQKDAESWICHMERLHNELQIAARSFRATGSRVRIAVLDTGYDDDTPFFFRAEVQSRLKGWKDWVDRGDQSEPVPKDTHGHGTYLVSLLMRLAPQADVYVARIAPDPDGLLDASNNVAEAITWASEVCKADIITISFGYMQEQTNILDAIRQVVYKGKDSVLFFAAASNSGGNSQEMFPARLDSVISVRGTDAKGGFQNFNPPLPDNRSFGIGTLGLDVPSYSRGADELVRYSSGTSVATVVAASLAACLIQYVNGRPLETMLYQEHEQVNRLLRQREGMLEMFKKLSVETRRRCRYLALWKLEGVSEAVRWSICLAPSY